MLAYPPPAPADDPYDSRTSLKVPRRPQYDSNATSKRWIAPACVVINIAHRKIRRDVFE